MGEVIVITSGKGGVGKTTTTANIGTGFAQEGKKVVLIDGDIGLRNLDVVMGLENRIVYDLVDVIEGNCRLKQAIIKDKRYDNLYLLPAAQTRDKNSVSPEQMKKLCQDLAPDFDYVLIDCPAGIEQGFRNAIAGADRALIVTTPEVAAVRDADRIISLLAADGKTNPQLIINRYRPLMVKKGDMMTVEDMIEILAVELIGVIPEDENIVIATNRGDPVINNPTALAGVAYKNIVNRLLGEETPLLTLETKTESTGLAAKLKHFFLRQEGAALKNWLHQLLGKKELILSKDLAKSRLQAALGYDRVHGSPQVLAEIKQELLKALAPYFPVDVDKVDVHFIYDPEGVTLMASMPVKQRPKATLHPAETDVQL